MAGQKLHYLTSPKDIQTVYKKFLTLTFDGFIKGMYIAFRMSPDGIAKMFGPLGSRDNKTVDLGSQQHVHLGTGVQKEQLQPGKQLDDLIAIYLNHIERQIHGHGTPQSSVIQVFTEGKVVSLRERCADVLSLATLEAIFVLSLLERAILGFFTITTYSIPVAESYSTNTLEHSQNRCTRPWKEVPIPSHNISNFRLRVEAKHATT